MYDKLLQIFQYVKENNQGYQALYSSVGDIDDKNGIDLYQKLPYIDKDVIRANQQQFLSTPYHFFPLNEKYMIRHTSGSTGDCFDVYWDAEDNLKSMINVALFRYRQFGIKTSDKFISFHTTTYIGNRMAEQTKWFIRSNNLSINKSLVSNAGVDDIKQIIIDFSPVWMQITPSILIFLKEKYMEIFDETPIRYIETIGESLPDSERMFFEKKGIAIVNNYGCVETNYIAMECAFGKKHVLSSTGFVEIKKDNLADEWGEIVVTSFYNHAMPIIKYRTGDYGQLINEHKCTCGMCSPILKLKTGRAPEYIILPNGEKFSWHPIYYAIEKTNELFGNPILRYQIIQTSWTQMQLNICLEDRFDDWFEAIREILFNNIQMTELYSFEWTIVKQKEFQVNTFGKTLLFVKYRGDKSYE